MSQSWKYQPPLNGGHYTGEPFLENAPWRAFPVVPCTAYMNHVNLRSADGPVQSLFQFPANIRPGNSSTDTDTCGLPGIAKFDGNKNFGPFSTILCQPCVKKQGCTCETGCGGHQKDCPSIGCQIKWIPID